MHVYIDESGVFKPLEGIRSRASGFGALILRSKTKDSLFEEFGYLSRRWEKSGKEVKGSALSEQQIAKVYRLLAKYDAILEATIVDAGLHRSEGIEAFKRAQAANIVANIPTTYSKAQVEHFEGLRDRWLQLPHQLAIQVIALTEVVEQAIQTSTLYYAQRRPAEIGSFEWVLDAKGRKRTTAETLWQFLVLPFLQSRSLEEPLRLLEGADYSHFLAAFDTQVPEYLIDKIPAGKPAQGANIKTILANLRFGDSLEEPGLRLVDIALSGLTRALNGTLQPDGWLGLGDLLVLRRPQSIRFIELWGGSGKPNPRFTTVVRQLEKSAKTMSPGKMRRL